MPMISSMVLVSSWVAKRILVEGFRQNPIRELLSRRLNDGSSKITDSCLSYRKNCMLFVVLRAVDEDFSGRLEKVVA